MQVEPEAAACCRATRLTLMESRLVLVIVTWLGKAFGNLSSVYSASIHGTTNLVRLQQLLPTTSSLDFPPKVKAHVLFLVVVADDTM